MHIITITGPTASGKTVLAAHLANRLHAEIISADSRQVYRGMDIGTGKDMHDYCIDGVSIPYHLIDIRDAGQKYNLYEFQHDFHRVFANLTQQDKIPILCGGTGLYIESVLKGYQLLHVPENKLLREKLAQYTTQQLHQLLKSYGQLHNTTDLTTDKRCIRAIEIAEYTANNTAELVAYPAIGGPIFCIDISRDVRRARISKRLKDRLDEGLIDEVAQLLEKNIAAQDLIYYGLEYKFVTLYLTKQITYNAMFTQLETAIHQFAKRQMTWFRGMEKRGFKLNYIDFNLSLAEKLEKMEEVLTSCR